MIIYNVTIKVENTIAEKWLQWLLNEHIADMIHTGCFTQAKVLRLMDVDETDGITYAVQYYGEDKSCYEKYIQQFADEMRKKGMEKWGDKFVAFRCLMEVVH